VAVTLEDTGVKENVQTVIFKNVKNHKKVTKNVKT